MEEATYQKSIKSACSDFFAFIPGTIKPFKDPAGRFTVPDDVFAFFAAGANSLSSIVIGADWSLNRVGLSIRFGPSNRKFTL